MVKKLHIVVPLFFLLFYGQGSAQDLVFGEVLSQALAYSFDRKIDKLEIEIRQEQLSEARAMYYPSLSLRFTNEYLYDIDDDSGNTVSVGETIISGNESTYQHSLALSAQYLLYDFGMRGLKYKNAERDILLSQYTSAQHLIDFRIEVLSLYGTGLKIQKKIQTWSTLLDVKRDVYKCTQRLVKSGSKNLIDQGNAAIAVAEVLQNFETLKLDMVDILEKLTYYTGKKYSINSVKFMDFTYDAGMTISTDASNFPEIKAYDIAIEKKKSELDIAKRHWLPTLTAYSSYRMYGNDRNSFFDSFENLEEKNATFGLMVNLNIFNGFSDASEVKRLQKELEKLQIEKAKKLAEHELKVRTLTQRNNIFKTGMANSAAYHTVLDNQRIMSDRLSDQQIIDRISFLIQKETQLEKQLTLKLADIERCMNALQLKILAQGTI